MWPPGCTTGLPSVPPSPSSPEPSVRHAPRGAGALARHPQLIPIRSPADGAPPRSHRALHTRWVQDPDVSEHRHGPCRASDTIEASALRAPTDCRAAPLTIEWRATGYLARFSYRITPVDRERAL